MEAVDLVMPLKKIENGDTKPQSEKTSKDKYFPIFVSVKNYGYMSPKEASEFLEASLNELKYEFFSQVVAEIQLLMWY